MPIISILEIKLQEKWKKSLILFVLLKDFYKQVFFQNLQEMFFFLVIPRSAFSELGQLIYYCLVLSGKSLWEYQS